MAQGGGDSSSESTNRVGNGSGSGHAKFASFNAHGRRTPLVRGMSISVTARAMMRDVGRVETARPVPTAIGRALVRKGVRIAEAPTLIVDVPTLDRVNARQLAPTVIDRASAPKGVRTAVVRRHDPVKVRRVNRGIADVRARTVKIDREPVRTDSPAVRVGPVRKAARFSDVRSVSPPARIAGSKHRDRLLIPAAETRGLRMPGHPMHAPRERKVREPGAPTHGDRMPGVRGVTAPTPALLVRIDAGRRCPTSGFREPGDRRIAGPARRAPAARFLMPVRRLTIAAAHRFPAAENPI